MTGLDPASAARAAEREYSEPLRWEDSSERLELFREELAGCGLVAQQGGLCVIMGEPGTGKTVIKQAIINHDPKRMITPAIARTLHTYSNTLQILCEAFGIEVNGRDTRREKLLIEAA